MTLQQILFGSFTPPPVFKTRHHYIDDIQKTSQREIRTSRLILDKSAITPWQKRVHMIVKSNDITTKEDVARKTKTTPGHCGTTLTALYKAHLIKRIKIGKGKTWCYGYTGRDK